MKKTMMMTTAAILLAAALTGCGSAARTIAPAQTAKQTMPRAAAETVVTVDSAIASRAEKTTEAADATACAIKIKCQTTEPDIEEETNAYGKHPGECGYGYYE